MRRTNAGSLAGSQLPGHVQLAAKVQFFALHTQAKRFRTVRSVFRRQKLHIALPALCTNALRPAGAYSARQSADSNTRRPYQAVMNGEGTEKACSAGMRLPHDNHGACDQLPAALRSCGGEWLGGAAGCQASWHQNPSAEPVRQHALLSGSSGIPAGWPGPRSPRRSR